MKPKIEGLKTGMVITTHNNRSCIIMKDTPVGDICVYNNPGEGETWGHLDWSLDRAIIISSPKEERDMLPRYWHEQRIIWELKNEKPFLTLDGVEYSESTLRSLIKKAMSCD